MRLVLRYSLFLCLLFLKGYNASFAGTQPDSSFNATSKTVQKSFIEFNNYRDPDEFFIGDDLIDDDEEELSLVRKKSQVPGYYSSTLTDAFILNSPFNSSNNNLRLHKSIVYLFPDKYIFLRVLRI